MSRPGKRWRWAEYAGHDGFRVASYNIHACLGGDRRHDVKRIADVIAELGCDTVGLQEVATPPGTAGDEQLDFLARETGMRAIHGLVHARSQGHFGNALLTRRPVLAVHRHDLSYARREPRGAIDAELDVDGVPVRVIVTHLGLRPAERRYQVRRMLALLHDLPRDRVVVVLGDINEWLPLGRPLRWLHGLLGRPPAERSFPVWCPVFSLDRVWVRPATAMLSFGVHRSHASRIASDHYPVRALIDVHGRPRTVPHA
jgi:endonuclease/exonuclease/phosphatase family metal-dependent hydrolase